MHRALFRAIALGSTFWSLIGGAVLSLAGSLLIDTLQGSSLPEKPSFAFVASGLLIASGVIFIRLSVSIDETVQKLLSSGYPTEHAALVDQMSADPRYARTQEVRILAGTGLCAITVVLFAVRATMIG